MRSRGSGPLLLALLMSLASAGAGAAPAIAIVIDDLGDTLGPGRATVALPGPVACAFLPESPHTRRLADEAHAAGKPVLLHLPLQPEAGKPHPLAVNDRLNAEARARHLQRMLAAVPHARGVNNHQGSRATADRRQMHWLMRELSLSGITYFIDSATSSQSEAYALARAYGLPTARRRVFLDNEPTPAAVHAQFERLLQVARRDGAALAIGHPHAATLQVLRERLPQLAQQGYQLVTPMQLIARSRAAPVVYPARLRYSEALAPGALLARTPSTTSIAPDAPAHNQAQAAE